MSKTMIKYIIDTNQREQKIFSIGFLTGCFFSLFPLIITMNLNNTITNGINYYNYIKCSIKKNKLLNGGKNIFYFDKDINSETINSFKNFVNELKDNEPLYLYFSTNGGSFAIAQMICDIILNHKGETNAIILNKSFSAGTLAVLCCSNIYMHSNAHLSPVDVMLCSFFDSTQLSSIKTVLDNKTPDKINDNTYVLADQARKCKTVLTKIYNKISIKHNFDIETKNKIWDEIFSGEKYTHQTTFSVEHLKTIGLSIKPITKEMSSLAKLCNPEKK